MSLSWRILGAFIVVILLAVTLSVAVGFYTTQGQLDLFTDRLGQVEANNLAQNLSRAYSVSGNWDSLDEALAESGYLYGGEGEGSGDGGGDEHGENGESGENDEFGSEVFHIDRIRIVIVDTAGAIIKDNFSTLPPGEIFPALSGQQRPIVEAATGQTVGFAYVDVNQDFLATESGGFLRQLLLSSALGGVVIAVVALLLAVWLSRRITAPITALTAATQMIATQGDSALLPVHSTDELGQMSTAFNQMTGALQTQRDLRRRLINDVSHELNTPLSVIRLEAHGLRKGFQEPSKAADQIIQEVDMLHNLVSDLNWLAESESEAMRLSRKPCVVVELLTAEVERWRPLAQQQQIVLNLSVPALQALPEPFMLNLDRMRMSQALGNVINNALQHSEAGGCVTIHGQVDESGGGEIAVVDDGVGIDPADLPHLFDRFYRADYARDRRTGGRGLGLAIARSIVEAHGGEISVVSQGVGRGTTVLFRLNSDVARRGQDGRLSVGSDKKV